MRSIRRAPEAAPSCIMCAGSGTEPQHQATAFGGGQVDNTDYGFIGVGRVGAHMARNLLRGGHSLTVYDKSAEAIAELAGAAERNAMAAAIRSMDMTDGPARRRTANARSSIPSISHSTGENIHERRAFRTRP